MHAYTLYESTIDGTDDEDGLVGSLNIPPLLSREYVCS